jgi:hypothetical protein
MRSNENDELWKKNLYGLQVLSLINIIHITKGFSNKLYETIQYPSSTNFLDNREYH